MNIKTVIVEDEAIAREVLRNYIEKYCPQIEIIAEAKEAKEATYVLNKLQPELIFLDVEMPFGNAFDVLESLEYDNYQVIFVTAYAHYAIEALNTSAAYYILKPIDIDALQSAVEKAVGFMQKSKELNMIENQPNPYKKQDSQIILPTQSGFDVVNTQEILRLQADGNFTKIFFEDGKTQLVCRFLKHFESQLSLPFMRIHRSHMVNLNRVTAYHRGTGGYVVMQDGYEVEVSPTYKTALIEYFSSEL